MTINKSEIDTRESYPYNRNMAQALYRSTFLESWGSGIHRIIEACREQGVEEPTWRWDGGFVYVTFKRPTKLDSNSAQVPSKYDPSSHYSPHKYYRDFRKCYRRFKKVL